MKSIATTETTARSSRSATRSPPRTSPYLSAGQTKALFSASLAGRLQRLEAEDMVNTDQAAEMTGTTRVTINAWIAKGRAIGLTQARRGFRLPKWQFEPGMWDAVPALSKALGTSEGWALITFLETPLGALQGATPRAAIEQGRLAQVLKIAEAEGT